MQYNKVSVSDLSFSDRTVLLRCDFNVPLDESGRVADDIRIRASLPTINLLLSQGAKVILCSHLGRPKGTVNLKYSLAPVAARLSALLGFDVPLASDVAGDSARALAAGLEPGRAMLLENLRFEPGEEKNDPVLSEKLASLADHYVNDAFGTAHRAHASTAGVADFLPAACGLLIEKELAVMGKALTDPARPFVAILGGAKVSDKLALIENLIGKCDSLLICGGMANTFIKSCGGSIGASLCDDSKLGLAADIMEKAAKSGCNLLLPGDAVIAREISADAENKVVPADAVPDGWMALDVGPETVTAYAQVIKGAKTVVWNGPAGVFECAPFAAGTEGVARAVAESGCLSIIGGGDSAAAAEQMGFADKITHVSTGGGASLEFLEGRVLPGVAALNDK